MKKIREFLGKPVVTAVLFALAVIMLAGGAIGGTRAALNIVSENYDSKVEVLNIGVGLAEKNKDGNYVIVSGSGKLMGPDSQIADLIGKDKDKKIMPGKAYPEELVVVNTGNGKADESIKEYVRVAVYKYWLDKDGDQKNPEMDSEWIKLGFNKDPSSGWTIDTDSTTEERTILYYDKALDFGEFTTPFLKTITIDEEATRKITRTEYPPDENGSVMIEWTYDYNGCKFCIEVHVDSVQDHNVDDAKISAWGVNK